MSAQEFKPGAEMWARVDRWPAAKEWPDDTSRVHLVSDEAGFWSATDDDPAAPLCIPPSCAEYIHPLPEFVVGQQVSTDDYPRLPVGAQALYKGATAPLVKGADEWTYLGEPMDGSPTGPRTLTYLPDAAEPEDKDDLYVEPARVTRVLHINGEGSGDVGAACGHELATGPGANPKHVGHSRSSFIGWIAGGGRDLSPETDACADCVALAQQPVTAPSVDNSEDATEPEPLKVGDAVLVWARVGTADVRGMRVFTVDATGGEWDAMTRPDAIVRPDAGQVPPWLVLPPLEEPKGIGAVVEAEVRGSDRHSFVRVDTADGTPCRWRSTYDGCGYEWAALEEPTLTRVGVPEDGAS